MTDNLDEEVRLWQERLFKRSIRRTRSRDRIIKLLGTVHDCHCLEISSGDGIISASLRKMGGSWKTAATTEAAAKSVNYSITEKIALTENGKLPFEDQTFHRVVIVDALKGVTDDNQFIRECHRVLKNDGWVIITEARRAPISFVALLQHLLNVSPIAKGSKRNGYTSSELFNILRDGFDVPETICYSNSLLESTATIAEFFQRVTANGDYWKVRSNVAQEELYRYRKLNSLSGFTYPLYWLFSKLEFLPGHKLIVKSRRRIWRPRLQPKLIDGRSIAEAAINTKIGTAAPF